MKKQFLTSLTLGSAVAVGALSASVQADINPFTANQLGSGYQVAQAEGEGKCGGSSAKSEEGKCGGAGKAKKGEGKCGEGKSAGPDKTSKSSEGKCGEGKCGGS